MTIIGILGKKGSGKDTIADYLVKNHDFVRFAFADKVKEVCKVMFNFTDQDFNEKNKEMVNANWNITPRQSLQLFGTEICRQILPSKIPEILEVLPFPEGFWIKHFIIWYENQLKLNPNIKVVVSDVRFIDEADIIKKYSGTLWKVNRNKKIYLDDSHISENQLDNYNSIDSILKNDSSLQNLYNQIEELLNIIS